MKKLIEEYKNVLNESSLKHHIDEFYKNAIPIKGNIPDKTFFCKLNDDNLISESELNTCACALIDLILKHSELFIISFDDIVKNINKNWRFYNLLIKTKKQYSIIVSYIDFSNPGINLINTFKKAKIDIVKEQFDDYICGFTERYNVNNGLLFPVNNYCILFLNLNEKHKFSEKTIEHELYHYFQIILHVNVCKEKHNIKIKAIYGFTDNEIKYLLNEKEFLTNITVDLPKQLIKLWKTYYQHLSKIEFLNLYLKEVDSNFSNIMNSNIGKLYRKVNVKDHSPFLLLPICKILNKTHLYSVGVKELKKHILII